MVTAYTVPYDGLPHTATYTIAGVNGETGATVGTVDVSKTTHTKAGIYASDTWNFPATANYNSIANTTITDTINPGALEQVRVLDDCLAADGGHALHRDHHRQGRPRQHGHGIHGDREDHVQRHAVRLAGDQRQVRQRRGRQPEPDHHLGPERDYGHRQRRQRSHRHQ